MAITLAAHPGSLVTVRFDGDPDTETYHLVAAGDQLGSDTVSVDSPLGHALVGATAGEVVGVDAPAGQLEVTVVSVG
ncbi:MAG: GreA/GreB family elongation factor [Actinomycetota bacterium]|nr:GreA/GreB family elongation factor [Actinomycetota bacterium]